MWTLYWLVYDCLIVLSREWAFADDCVDRGRRPLILVWGDSTAGALMPGLRKAQESRAFGLAQFTASSCIPALNTDVAGGPDPPPRNHKGFSLAGRLKAAGWRLPGPRAQGSGGGGRCGSR